MHDGSNKKVSRQINNRLFECKKCGKCCIKYCSTFSATENDIKRWKKEKRLDIISYVSFMDPNKTWGDLFFNPKTGEEIFGRCPFLRKDNNKITYHCQIHTTKPDVCRNYPTDKKCLFEVKKNE